MNIYKKALLTVLFFPCLLTGMENQLPQFQAHQEAQEIEHGAHPSELTFQNLSGDITNLILAQLCENLRNENKIQQKQSLQGLKNLGLTSKSMHLVINNFLNNPLYKNLKLAPYKWHTASCIRKLQLDPETLHEIDYTNNNLTLFHGPYQISVLDDKKKVKRILYIYNSKTKSVKTRTEHKAPITALALSRLGDIIASGDQNGCVKLWDPSTGLCINTLTCFNRDGENTTCQKPSIANLVFSDSLTANEKITLTVTSKSGHLHLWIPGVHYKLKQPLPPPLSSQAHQSSILLGKKPYKEKENQLRNTLS